MATFRTRSRMAVLALPLMTPVTAAWSETLPPLTCSFESQHLAASEPGTWVGLEKGNSTTLTFTDIDLARQTARVAQNPAAGEIRVVKGAGTLTFLDVTPQGSVIATTIVVGDQGLFDRALNAAHSRHVVMPNHEITVAQYIGFCERAS